MKVVFIDLLIYASHKERKWQGQVLPRGSLITTYAVLANRNGLSEQKVRTALDKLEKARMINRQKTHNKTLITVLNYSKYQGDDSVEKSSSQHTNNKQSTDRQQTSNKPLTDEQHTYIYKNEKNVKNDKNERDKQSFGKYKNILLSHAEYTELKAEYSDCDKLIEELSSYIQSEGKHYADHFATLERWAKREAGKQGKLKAQATYDLSEYDKFAQDNTEI